MSCSATTALSRRWRVLPRYASRSYSASTSWLRWWCLGALALIVILSDAVSFGGGFYFQLEVIVVGGVGRGSLCLGSDRHHDLHPRWARNSMGLRCGSAWICECISSVGHQLELALPSWSIVAVLFEQKIQNSAAPAAEFLILSFAKYHYSFIYIYI